MFDVYEFLNNKYNEVCRLESECDTKYRELTKAMVDESGIMSHVQYLKLCSDIRDIHKEHKVLCVKKEMYHKALEIVEKSSTDIESLKNEYYKICEHYIASSEKVDSISFRLNNEQDTMLCSEYNKLHYEFLRIYDEQNGMLMKKNIFAEIIKEVEQCL